MLVAGILVIKDMNTGNVPGVDKREMVKRAQDTAEQAQKAGREAANAMEEAMGKVRTEP